MCARRRAWDAQLICDSRVHSGEPRGKCQQQSTVKVAPWGARYVYVRRMYVTTYKHTYSVHMPGTTPPRVPLGRPWYDGMLSNHGVSKRGKSSCQPAIEVRWRADPPPGFPRRCEGVRQTPLSATNDAILRK